MTDSTAGPSPMTVVTAPSGEREELLATLRQARFFLRHTVRDLTDEQAAMRPTVSELCLGGLIKHVASTERVWARFATEGPTVFPDWQDAGAMQARGREFAMEPGETLAQVLEEYAVVAARTDDLVLSAPDLDAVQPLPVAPWFPAGSWSVRRVLLHISAETAQHAGHADILRESIDGAKTMG